MCDEGEQEWNSVATVGHVRSGGDEAETNEAQSQLTNFLFSFRSSWERSQQCYILLLAEHALHFVIITAMFIWL